MRPFEAASRVTPDERLSELAEIFAAGVLRLRRRSALPLVEPSHDRENVSESLANRLELSRETVLSVPTVSGFREPAHAETQV